MKAIVDWLTIIEHSAHKFYNASSEFFHGEIELKNFLQHIANDEAEHYHIMASANQFLSTLPFRKPQIEVDDSIKARIENTFRTAQDLLDCRKITKESLIDCIVESEFSEWNDLFLYVLNTLKTEDRIFEHSALQVQRHMRHIEHYLKSSEYGRNKLQLFTKLPYSKKGKILIVDDEPAISELMCAMLEEICDSDLADNGAEALEKIKKNPYDLVISDINMPGMDGLELYEKASHLFNRPNDSFIFHTGNLTDDLRGFFEINNIMYLEKPSSIMEIRDVVNSKLHLE